MNNYTKNGVFMLYYGSHPSNNLLWKIIFNVNNTSNKPLWIIG